MERRVQELLLVLKDQGLKQKEIADRIGVTEAAVSKWRSGQRNVTEQTSVSSFEKEGATVTDQTIKSICYAVRGLRESWLRTGEGEMFTSKVEDNIEDVIALYTDDPMIRSALDYYLRLDEDGRELLQDFVSNLASGISPEDEREKLHKELDRQIDLEKEAPRSEAS